jgi:hypothetical protein
MEALKGDISNGRPNESRDHRLYQEYLCASRPMQLFPMIAKEIVCLRPYLRIIYETTTTLWEPQKKIQRSRNGAATAVIHGVCILTKREQMSKGHIVLQDFFKICSTWNGPLRGNIG